MQQEQVAQTQQQLYVFAAAWVGCALDAVHEDPFTLQQFIEQAAIVPAYIPLARRLLAGMCREGQLLTSGPETFTRQGRDYPRLRVEAAAACASAHPAEVELIRRCGEALPQVLAGEKDARGLLFSEGSAELVNQMYQHTPFARFYGSGLTGIFRSLIRAAPPDVQVRVLEIGAGTGGTTAWLLPELPPLRTQYLFTDMSSYFFGRARRKFEEFFFVEYAPLDVSRPPGDQGLSGPFDVIVAANVLHATPDLAKTVAHVRSLLAPGGFLLLWEITDTSVVFDLSFGLLLGPLADEETRDAPPFLTVNGWQRLLGDHGFDRVAGFSEAGEQSSSLRSHLILAQVLAGADQTEVAFSRSHEPAPTLAQRVAQAPLSDRAQLMLDVVESAIVTALGKPPGSMDEPLGLPSGSLMTGRLKNALHRQLRDGTRLPEEAVAGNVSPRMIAGYLATHVLGVGVDFP